jgi:hypothetical protein
MSESALFMNDPISLVYQKFLYNSELTLSRLKISRITLSFAYFF